MNANYYQTVEIAEEELRKIYLETDQLKLVNMLIASNKALNSLIKPTPFNTITLQSVSDKISKFSDETFGKDRPFTAPLHHMKLEVEEVIQSGDEEEFADVLLLLLDSYRKRFPKNSTDDLLNCSANKIEALKYRKWQKPDENGVFQHVREEIELVKYDGIHWFDGFFKGADRAISASELCKGCGKPHRMHEYPDRKCPNHV